MRAGAFDRVWHAVFLEKLHAKGVQGDLLHFLSDYLQDSHLVAAEFRHKLNLIRSGESAGRSTLPAVRPRQ